MSLAPVSRKKLSGGLGAYNVLVVTRSDCAVPKFWAGRLSSLKVLDGRWNCPWVKQDSENGVLMLLDELLCEDCSVMLKSEEMSRSWYISLSSSIHGSADDVMSSYWLSSIRQFWTKVCLVNRSEMIADPQWQTWIWNKRTSIQNLSRWKRSLEERGASREPVLGLRRTGHELKYLFSTLLCDLHCEPIRCQVSIQFDLFFIHAGRIRSHWQDRLDDNSSCNRKHCFGLYWAHIASHSHSIRHHNGDLIEFLSVHYIDMAFQSGLTFLWWLFSDWGQHHDQSRYEHNCEDNEWEKYQENL